MSDKDHWMTTAVLAQRAGVSRPAIYRYMKQHPATLAPYFRKYDRGTVWMPAVIPVLRMLRDLGNRNKGKRNRVGGSD